MKAILALDQGTTSSRAILFDARSAELAVALRELRQFNPQQGWGATKIAAWRRAVESAKGATPR